MSWSISGINVSKGDVLAEDGDRIVTEGIRLSDEGKEQFLIAVMKAFDVIDTGVVGDPDGDYTISVSGHSNPNHKPTGGWANDYVSINIYQK